MGKGLNRERRREKQRRETAPPTAVFVDEVVNETPPSTLRLVRFENEHVSVKPLATGRSGTVVDTVQQPERSGGSGGT